MKKGLVLRKKQEVRESALARIRELLEKAAQEFVDGNEKARLLVKKAHALRLKSRVKLPLSLKRSYCKKCFSLWVPGKSVRVRIAKGRVVYTCLSCRRVKRVPVGR